MKKPHIMLGCPSHDEVKTSFAFSLPALYNDLGSHGVTTSFYNLRGTCIEDSRNETVKKALEAGCSHIMWIDSDIEFPADAVRRLLKHNLNIVGGTYRRRRGDYSFTHAELAGIDHTAPLRRVAYLPGGFILVDTRVYQAIEERWYDREKIAETGANWGEDIAFCFRAVQCGYDIWLDEEISHGLKHVGEFEFPASADDLDPRFLAAYGLTRAS